MKLISTIFIFLLGITNCKSQIVKGILDVTNANPNMYIYGQYSDYIIYYFLGINNYELNEYKLSEKINLDSISLDFKNSISRDFIEDTCYRNFVNNPKYEKGKVWIEKTLYLHNLKTKKVQYLYQIYIEFEGLVSGTESASYAIKNIICLKKDSIKKRDKLINSIKYDFSLYDGTAPVFMEQLKVD